MVPCELLHISYNLFAGTEMLSLSVYEPIAIQILIGGGPSPNLGEGVELGGRVWYPVKAHHNGHNLSITTETLSLSVYEPIAIQILLGGPSPNFGDRLELGGRVSYPLKVLRIRYNLFAGTETLSLSVYEPIAMQILLGGLSPKLGEGLS